MVSRLIVGVAFCVTFGALTAATDGGAPSFRVDIETGVGCYGPRGVVSEPDTLYYSFVPDQYVPQNGRDLFYACQALKIGIFYQGSDIVEASGAKEYFEKAFSSDADRRWLYTNNDFNAAVQKMIKDVDACESVEVFNECLSGKNRFKRFDETPLSVLYPLIKKYPDFAAYATALGLQPMKWDDSGNRIRS